jgi:hypothetical protein
MIGLLRTKDENGNWVAQMLTGVEGPQGVQGPKGPRGDMDSSVYDPQGKAQDIFAYIDAVFAAL